MEREEVGQVRCSRRSTSFGRSIGLRRTPAAGGVMNPDKLRMNPKAVEFVKHFIDARKPVAAICHGPWTLVEAGAVRGRTLTSWPSLQTDIRNAGGNWVDEEVVTDRGIVTSRRPDD